MVFAVWAGRSGNLTAAAREAFLGSWEWGLDHTGEMVAHAVTERGYPEDLAREYFTHYISYRLTPRHLEGLSRFRELVSRLEPLS